MEDKEIELSEKQLESITGGAKENLGFKCPYCNSSNITTFHSPSRGAAYLCCDCYHSININELKK